MFVKGQSGNPGGRKKTPELFKEHTDAAIRRVIRISQSSDEKIALDALKLILAYSLGKPKESVEHSGTVTLESLLGDTRE